MYMIMNIKLDFLSDIIFQDIIFQRLSSKKMGLFRNAQQLYYSN